MTATETTLPLIRFNTAVAPSAQRFELYRSTMANTWDLSPRETMLDSFHAAMLLTDLGSMLIYRAMVAPRRVDRSLRRARADGQEHYALVLLRNGRAEGMAAEKEITFEAGELRLFDMAHSLQIDFDATNTLALCLHRDELDALAPPTGKEHGLLLDGPMGALLREHVINMSEITPRLTSREAPELARATYYLLAAALAPTRERGEQARLPLHAALMQQARRLVDAHLNDRDLTADTIGRALGISRSGLYRLMEVRGGVAAFVQRRRLLHVHRALSDKQDRRKISELALSHGFTSETHFSRAFRKCFGYTPSDVRIGSTVLPQWYTGARSGIGHAFNSWVMRA
jgi:AraC-like DNA-binding protein